MKRRRDEERSRPGKIRGWLLLVAVGVLAFPLRLADFIYEDLLPAFQKEVWSLLTTPGSQAYHPFNGPILLFELAGNLMLLLYALWLVLLFFKRHRWLPVQAVSFLSLALLFYVADYVASHQIPAVASQQETESKLDLLGAVLVCAILVPYFLLSKRVKETFIRVM